MSQNRNTDNDRNAIVLLPLANTQWRKVMFSVVSVRPWGEKGPCTVPHTSPDLCKGPCQVEDPRGRQGHAHPPLGSKFFHFHAFFGKKCCQIIDWCPLLSGVGAPCVENPGSVTADPLPHHGHVQTCSLWSVYSPQAGGRLASHWNAFLFCTLYCVFSHCKTWTVGPKFMSGFFFFMLFLHSIIQSMSFVLVCCKTVSDPGARIPAPSPRCNDAMLRRN